MQNMQGQGMLLSNLQLGSQNSQWQQSNLQQAQQSQPTGFPGMMQAGPCPQTILTPVQGAVQLIGMPTAMQAMPSMQMCVPVNCQNVPNVPNMIVGNQEWNQWQQHVDQAPPAGGCVTTVKNTFLHAEEQQAAMARRRESSEPPRPRSMEGFEDSDDELGNYHMEGHDVRQFSEPPHTNGQYLVIPSQNSLKSAGRAQMANVSISMEQQLQQMNGKHQAEQQQLLAHQQMEQQKFLQQYQQQRQIETMHEELQGDNTDDEDCIGQYPLLPRPATTSDGSMHWMTAALESMCVRPTENHAPHSSNMGMQRPATMAMADTGSTPEPCTTAKKFNKKLPKKEEDGGSGASMADQLAIGDASKKKAQDPYKWEDGVVTVMVRQLPRQYTQRMLLQEVVRRGFEGLFDFLYLPYDFKKGINVGYGFINFTEPEYALQFRDSLDGQYLDKYMRIKGKAARVHPAAVQGYEANYRHFAHTKTGQKQDPAFSPLFFPVVQGGMQELVKQLDVQASVQKPPQNDDAVQAKAAAPRLLDSNVFPCQQIPQLPMQQSRIPNGAMDSVPPQLVQVSAQGFSGPMDERQLPKPKGKAKKQTAQTKQPMPMAFNSGGGVTWVGIPVGTAAAQSWLETRNPNVQAQESPQQGVTYGWFNSDVDLNC